jgi:UDP:flavonoid glycosyltransferase YjiC (YdhE family)
VCARHRSPTLRFETDKVDLMLVGRQCDVALTHGTHGTTVGLLLAGKPVLHLPLFLEQAILARNVSRLGAGIEAPAARPEVVCGRADDLLASTSYARRAAAFAAHHAGFDPVAENGRMAGEVERLIN